MDKSISGNEVKMINTVFNIYCNDVKCAKDDIEYFVFELEKKDGLYEIKIKDIRFDLGGDGVFYVNSNTLEIVSKSYGE